MNEHPVINRRQFARILTLGTVTSLSGSGALQQTLIGDIGVEFISTVGHLRLRVSDYPALEAANGSIRISVNPLRSNHQPDGTFHPILVNRLEDGSLKALSSECSHASCAVRTYSQTSRSHLCPCHNSRFTLDGRRISGPAPFDLESYETVMVDDDTIDISIPRLGFTVNSCLEANDSKAPLKLEFPARRSVTYRVVQREDLSTPWEPISFATTPNGGFDQTELVGTDNFAAVYVSRDLDQGFIAVQVVVKEV